MEDQAHGGTKENEKRNHAKAGDAEQDSHSLGQTVQQVCNPKEEFGNQQPDHEPIQRQAIPAAFGLGGVHSRGLLSESLCAILFGTLVRPNFYNNRSSGDRV